MATVESETSKRVSNFLDTDISPDTKIELYKEFGNDSPVFSKNVFSISGKDLKEFDPSEFFFNRLNIQNPLPQSEYDLHSVLAITQITMLDDKQLSRLEFDKIADDAIRATAFFESDQEISTNHIDLKEHSSILPFFFIRDDIKNSNGLRVMVSNPTFDINTIHEDRRTTLLHFAADANNSEAISILQTNGNLKEDLLIRSEKKELTPLALASLKGNTAAVRALLQSKNAPINFRREESPNTPLALAVEGQNLNTVKTILADKRCRANIPVFQESVLLGLPSRTSLINFATEIASHGEEGYEILETLVNSKQISMQFKEANKASLHKKAEKGNKRAIKKLGAEKRKLDSRTPLLLAVDNDDEKAVRILCESKREDLKYNALHFKGGYTALSSAILKGSLPIVQTLLAHDGKEKVHVNHRDCVLDTPFLTAIKALSRKPESTSRQEIFSALAKHSFTNLRAVDASKYNACHLAALRDCSQALKQLCIYSPIITGINQKGPDEQTPLQTALNGYLKESANVLLRSGKVELGPESQDGRNLLKLAASNQVTRETISRLYHALSAKFPNDFQEMLDGEGSPLTVAIESQNELVAKFLLDQDRVYVSSGSNGGINPLFLAADDRYISPNILGKILDKATQELPVTELGKMLNGHNENNALNHLFKKAPHLTEKDLKRALVICKHPLTKCSANQLVELIYFTGTSPEVYPELVKKAVSKLPNEEINATTYQAILDHGNLKINKELKDPLIFFAMRRGNATVAKSLFNNPLLNPFAQNANDENMLHLLADRNCFYKLNNADPELVKTIFEKCIEINLAQKNSYDKLTPIELAFKNENFEFVKLAIACAKSISDLKELPREKIERLMENLFESLVKTPGSKSTSEKIEILNLFLENFSSFVPHYRNSFQLAQADYMSKAIGYEDSRLRDNLLNIKDLDFIVEAKHWLLAIKNDNLLFLKAFHKKNPNTMNTTLYNDIKKMGKVSEKITTFLKEQYPEYDASCTIS